MQTIAANSSDTYDTGTAVSIDRSHLSIAGRETAMYDMMQNLSAGINNVVAPEVLTGLLHTPVTCCHPLFAR